MYIGTDAISIFFSHIPAFLTFSLGGSVCPQDRRWSSLCHAYRSRTFRHFERSAAESKNLFKQASPLAIPHFCYFIYNSPHIPFPRPPVIPAEAGIQVFSSSYPSPARQ
jgi:hypothetical protein